MLRKTVVILAILLSSLATQVFALGLGTVTVESALNQPLRIRIEILQLGDTRLQDVTVQMASAADFQRFNIDRIGFLSNIRFSVASSADGNFVTLTSSQVVREPYLSFILDTRWPNGRLLSEHTVLLDLPVFDDQQQRSTVRQPISPVLQPPGASTPAAPVAPAPAVTPAQTPAAPAPEPVAEPEPTTPEPAAVAEAVEPAAPAPEPEPVVVEEEPVVQEPAVQEEVAPEPEPAPVTPTSVDSTAAPVAEVPEPVTPETLETTDSDTLSDIALQVRPDDSVTLQQTMLAIQRLNPDAFVDGNINRMRSGQVLRVPNLAEVQEVDARTAASEITRQNQEFATADVQPLAAPATQTPDQTAAPQGQLSVVSSDEEAIDASSLGGELDAAENEVLDQRIAELENQLAIQQEEADRARIEREELDQRMDELEEQIAAAQEIIRLQDLQLAQLQESLAQAAAEQATQEAAIAAAEAQMAEQAANRTSLSGDLMRIITGNMLFVGFGLVLVILLLVFLLLRRNRAKLDDSDLEELDAEEVVPQEKAGRTDSEEFTDYDEADLDSELDQIIGIDEDSNPIAQADTLLKKGNVSRAVTLLQLGLDKDPDNQAIRMKLLEALAKQGDLSAFEEQADLVEDADLEAQVNALRRSIKVKAPEPERKPVSFGRRQTTEEEDRLGAASFLDDLGIDLDAFDDDEEEEAPPAPAPAAKPEPVAEEKKPAAPSLDDDSFLADDMDLTFDLVGDDEEPTDKGADSDAEATEDSAEEPDESLVTDELDAPAALDLDDAEATAEVAEPEAMLDFDLGEDEVDSISSAGDSKDPDELEIESFEFSVDDKPDTAPAAAPEPEPEIELETFAFETDDLDLDKPAVEEAKAPDIAAENLLDFDFDKSEIKPEESTADAGADELETFEFDLDEKPAANPEATVVEKPASDDLDIDIDDFDLDDDEPVSSSAKAASSDDTDFLDLDAMDGEDTVIETAQDDVEFDFDDDEESAPKAATPAVDSASLEDELDDLEFLSDDDEVEIDSVDDVEEVDMLSDADEVATKLELAYAYRKMGDVEGAREILQEVINEGSEAQVKEAQELIASLDGDA